MSGQAQASIPASEVRTITSRHVEQTYRISVALPYSYASQPDKTYPTVYLVDANWYFGMVTETTRIMQLCETFPEVMVVGIGYPVAESMLEAHEQIYALRARDLTPTVSSRFEQSQEKQGRKVTSGGAEQFLAFIENELIPLIEKEYRSSAGKRILAGHSFGGLFTLYALFKRPALFAAYVAASPSFDYGDNPLFGYEAAFAAQHKALPVKLYISAGEREESPDDPTVSSVYRFAGLLESRKYEGLALTRHIIPNCDHCAATAPAFQAGLQAVLV